MKCSILARKAVALARNALLTLLRGNEVAPEREMRRLLKRLDARSRTRRDLVREMYINKVVA